MNVFRLVEALKNTVLANEVYSLVFYALRLQANTKKFIVDDFKLLCDLRQLVTTVSKILIHENITQTKAFKAIKNKARLEKLSKKTKLDHLIIYSGAEVNAAIESRLIPKRRQLKFLRLYYKLYTPYFRHRLLLYKVGLARCFESWRQTIIDEKVMVLNEIASHEEGIEEVSEKIVDYENKTEAINEKLGVAMANAINCTACRSYTAMDFNGTMMKDDTVIIGKVPQFNCHFVGGSGGVKSSGEQKSDKKTGGYVITFDEQKDYMSKDEVKDCNEGNEGNEDADYLEFLKEEEQRLIEEINTINISSNEVALEVQGMIEMINNNN